MAKGIYDKGILFFTLKIGRNSIYTHFAFKYMIYPSFTTSIFDNVKSFKMSKTT